MKLHISTSNRDRFKEYDRIASKQRGNRLYIINGTATGHNTNSSINRTSINVVHSLNKKLKAEVYYSPSIIIISPSISSGSTSASTPNSALPGLLVSEDCMLTVVDCDGNLYIFEIIKYKIGLFSIQSLLI